MDGEKDLRYMKEWLGHSGSKTIEKYTHVAITCIIRFIPSCHQNLAYISHLFNRYSRDKVTFGWLYTKVRLHAKKAKNIDI